MVMAVTAIVRARNAICAMAFKIFRKLSDGQMVEVAIHGDLKEAESLVRALEEHWPGVYLITESEEDESE